MKSWHPGKKSMVDVRAENSGVIVDTICICLTNHENSFNRDPVISTTTESFLSINPSSYRSINPVSSAAPDVSAKIPSVFSKRI
ncbi:MAG: hypothetical protein HXS47_03230 [Theionarchaea archaeon]|nr:hypothetical protein [Theionarchaea archaeon]